MVRTPVLLLFVAMSAAFPKDFLKRHEFFGLPDETAAVDANPNNQKSPSNINEHLAQGVEDDEENFRRLWQMMGLKGDFLRVPSSRQETTSTPSTGMGHSAGLPELNLFPDIKLLQYSLPQLPEMKFPELPPIPELQLPDIKVIKYDLPPLPEIQLPELPPLPEITLPDFKVVKYQLPQFPEVELPSLPELPTLEFPDIKLVKYELPDFPDMKVDLPPLPELQLPDIKLMKFELPQLPEMKPLDSFPFFFPKTKVVEIQVPAEASLNEDGNATSVTSQDNSELEMEAEGNNTTIEEQEVAAAAAPEETSALHTLVRNPPLVRLRQHVPAEVHANGQGGFILVDHSHPILHWSPLGFNDLSLV